MHTRIKQIRKHYHLTQKQFADAIGLKEPTITAYEKQYRTPSAGTIKNICHTFGVNEQWLTEGIGDMLLTDDTAKEQAYHRALQLQAAQIAAQTDPTMKELIAFLWTLTEEEFFVLKSVADKWKNREKID